MVLRNNLRAPAPLREKNKFQQQAATSPGYRRLTAGVSRTKKRSFYNNEYGLNLNTALTDEYSKVDISYTAYFLDGTVYETVPANSLPYYTALPYGLQEVLRKMKTGSKWKVWLPQSLCYGSDGVQNDDGSYVVDPYTSLIYEIEFLSFQY